MNPERRSAEPPTSTTAPGRSADGRTGVGTATAPVRDAPRIVGWDRRRAEPWETSSGDAPPAGGSGTELADSPDRFFNSEVSWLDFGARLLELTDDDRLPLLERVKFLAIFAEGLDEFFQVRVAGLEDQIAAGLRTRSPDGMSPAEQLALIRERSIGLVGAQNRIYTERVRPALAAAGIAICDWRDLDAADRAHLLEVFNRSIFPILTPLAVDQAHPFPYISNLSLNLVVRVADPTTGDRRIARVKVPPLIPRLVVLRDGARVVPVEQVIAAHLSSLFPAMDIVEHYHFRVTRNADLSIDGDESQDMLAAVEHELHRRRFGQAVRLEVAATISEDLLELLITSVDVPRDNVFLIDAPIDLGGLRGLADLGRADLAAEHWSPLTPPQLAGGEDLFTVLARSDVLVHHPYESFETSVEAFLGLAAEDPDVLAIRQTLYRTGEDSPIVDSLIRASQAGKQVTVVVELQARFDEQVNIARARALEEAGVEVIYGLMTLKTHSKISLVIRREGDDLRRYCHIGSGNYNSYTARFYEDVGLFTADPGIGADVGELFRLLTGAGLPSEFSRLLVSPMSTRTQLVEEIDEEAGAGARGRIVLKTNGLTDPEIIDALYRASAAGVSTDLIVRGRCCLRPGVPGLSEHIRVRSIVGRYLEHSRIFRFGGVDGRPLRIAFGSPDLMERNLDRRVEVVVPVEHAGMQQRLVGILDDVLRDEANSWLLGPDGAWLRVSPPGVPAGLGFNVQDHFQAQALESRRHRRDGGAVGPSDLRPPPAPAGPASRSPRSRWWRRRSAQGR